MTTNQDAFTAELLGMVDADRQFEAQVFYDRDGDCIEFLASDEPYYAERIDSLVTVYYGRETGEIVGSLIKGVRRFIDKVTKTAPGFRIDVEDGEVHLEHLFTARLWCSEDEPENPVVITYKRLRLVAEEKHAKANLSNLAGCCN